MSGHECAPCGRQFRLYQHYQDHMIHSAQHHYCAPCNRDFGSQQAIDSHLRHSQKHAICKWCRTEVGILRIHYRSHHEQCSECSQWCKDADEVHWHCSVAHSGVYCAPCKRLFVKPNALRMHAASSAHLSKNLACPYPACDRLFTSKAALVQHLEADSCPSGVDMSEVDRYFSGYCDRDQRFVRKDFILPSFFPKDIFRDNNARYNCPLCPKHFRHKAELVSHLKSSKHNNRGLKAYKCPSKRCGKTEFYSLGNLLFHAQNGACEPSHFIELYELVDKLFKIVKNLK